MPMAPDVVVVIEGGDEHLERGVHVGVRRRHVGDDRFEDRGAGFASG